MDLATTMPRAGRLLTRVNSMGRPLLFGFCAGVTTLSVSVALVFMLDERVGIVIGLAACTALTATGLYQLHSHVERRVADAMAMPILASMLPGHLPHSMFSLMPDAIIRVLNEIRFGKVQTVVECGAGLSTLYIAQLMKRTSGHDYVLEHDLEWAQVIDDLLEEHGLSGWATVIRAPLERLVLEDKEFTWYSRSAVQRLAGVREVGPHAR
jgi:hypothetical protein